MMKVVHFGATAQPLLGALHSPRRLRARSAAVLLCNPFGEESARAHRIYRSLAMQLERAGYSVLRFDYGGTGDSMGNGDDVSVEGWLGDIERAAEELRTASGARKLVAIGLRLGGTLAALATARSGLRLRHLVLWDPVIDGAAYLRELANAHRSYMQQELGASTAWTRSLRISSEGFPSEALGAPISDALAAGMSAVDLTAHELHADHVTVISTSSSPAVEGFKKRVASSATTRWLDIQGGPAWNSDAALNAAVVPMDIVQAIVERVEELSP